MRIDPEDKLVGYPIVAIRDMLKKLVFDRTWVEQTLKADGAEADRVVRELQTARYIVPLRLKNSPEAERWETTPEGTRLANASTLPSITRAQADEIMAAFMDRVRSVRELDTYLYEVLEVVLFGSYLRGAPEVNDIDVIVKLRPKQKFASAYGEVLAEKLRQAHAAGKKFPRARDWFEFLQNEVSEYLKGDSGYVNFHRSDVFQLIEKAARRQTPGESRIVHDTTHKVVYRAEG
ncbi:MAG: nucleotidyltransferase domain-containing protein [Alphaproteobacteria bacterium]